MPPFRSAKDPTAVCPFTAVKASAAGEATMPDPETTGGGGGSGAGGAGGGVGGGGTGAGGVGGGVPGAAAVTVKLTGMRSKLLKPSGPESPT